MRVNSGGVKAEHKGKPRYYTFVQWQAPGYRVSSKGVADIEACCKGRFVAIEVKRRGRLKNVSQAQRDYLKAVTEAGGLAIIADDVKIVQEVI